MEELDEVVNELNWKERIVVRIFTKTFKRVYNVTRVMIINSFIK